MDITQLEARYEAALRPVFGPQLRIVHQRDDFAHVILDGDQEDFHLTLYGTDHARLYWCNECFIFHRQRDQLVSSDTYGEIVYEGVVSADTLPPIIIDLILQLKDSEFLSKDQRVTGKTPSGYDEIRDYTIQAKTSNPPPRRCRLANILIEFNLI